MSLETYRMRTLPWSPEDCAILSRESAEFSCVAIAAGVMQGNELIQRRMDDARLASQIERQNADTRRFWGPIVPRGGKC